MIGTAQKTWFGGWWRRAAPTQNKMQTHSHQRLQTATVIMPALLQTPALAERQPPAGAWRRLDPHMAGSLVECAECVGRWLRKQQQKAAAAVVLNYTAKGCDELLVGRGAVALVGGAQQNPQPPARRFVRRLD